MKKKSEFEKETNFEKELLFEKETYFVLKLGVCFLLQNIYLCIYSYLFLSMFLFFKCIFFSNWQYIHTKLVLLSLWYLIPLIFFNVDNLVKHFLENCIVFLKHFLWQCCSGYENQRGRISKKFWWVFIIEFWYSS